MNEPRPIAAQPRHAIAIAKGRHSYIVFLDGDDPEQRCEALRQFARWASNPEFNFGWDDAADLSSALRKGSLRPWPQ